MKKAKKKKGRRRREVILLEDLAPRRDVRGGSGRILFGQHVDPEESPEEKRKAHAEDPGRASDEEA